MKRANGVFPLPDSDSHADSDAYGYNSNMQNCFHRAYTDSYSDSNRCHTNFDTDIGTDKVEFKS